MGKMYVGVSNVAKNVKTIYVGVNGVAHKVVKGYVGVNGVAHVFWDGGSTPEYNEHIRATSFFLPNVAYNLNKLDLRTTIETALETCSYIAGHVSSIVAMVDKFKAEMDNIWTYASARLTDEDTVHVNVYMANMGYPYIDMYFAKTNTTSVQLSTANTTPPMLMYRLSSTISVSSKKISVEYDASNNTFSYSSGTSTMNIMTVGGYGFYFTNGSNPADYQVLNYSANNIGATKDKSAINPNNDYFMIVDCKNGRVIEGSGSNSNNAIVDDNYNYYQVEYTKTTSRVEKTVNGLEIKSSYITIPSALLNRGLADYIFKFGAIDPSTALYSYGGWLLYMQNNFGIYYNTDPTYRDVGWYFRNEGTFTLISTNANLFNNALVQMHFLSQSAFDLYVNGSAIKTNIPCTRLQQTSMNTLYIGHTNYSMSIIVEKVAISRSKEIVLTI